MIILFTKSSQCLVPAGGVRNYDGSVRFCGNLPEINRSAN